MWKYRPEPTPEQRMRAKTLRQKEIERQERYNREMDTIYNNSVCPVCGHSFMTGFICRFHRASICENHCKECGYSLNHSFKCIYKEKEDM